MKKQGSGPSAGSYFPDERDLDSISLVSKRFLSISNQAKLSLNVNDGTLPLLPNLLRRFRHIETIGIDVNAHKDIDGLVDQISRSGVLSLQAIEFRWCMMMREPPRHGLKALALNKNIKNNLNSEDDGVDALASNLKELKKIVFKDKGVMEVVRNCERLRDIHMGGCEKVSASIVLQMVSSRPSLRNIEPPCFDDLSEQMIDKVLSFGCRLSAIRLWLSS
ncbi:hypothetical protein C3L33_05513, partial [Rhododendron williamsianum]